MMNKRALAGLSVALLLLLFGMVSVQKRRVQRDTERFRASFLRRAPFGESGHLAEVILNSEKEPLGYFEGEELDAALKEVELAWPHPKFIPPKNESRSFGIETGSIWNGDGKIRLWVGSDQGEVYFPSHSGAETGEWTLSPESCRALKRRIWARFGDKLRALPVSPPEPQ